MISTQAVVAFLRRKGFPIAKVGDKDARKDRAGFRGKCGLSVKRT